MRKIISLIVALCVILTPAFPAFAANEENAALNKAIPGVKQFVDIPGSYTDFLYESYIPDEDKPENVVWMLDWSDPDLEIGSIHAEIDWNGNLLYFSQYDYESEDGLLGKVTRAQGETTAKNILKKMYPEFAADMKEINREGNRSYTYKHYYDYQLYVNNLPVPFINIQIGIDKYTGKLSTFYGLPAGFVLPAFSDPKPEIGKEEAVKAFLDYNGLELIYSSRSNDDGTTEFYPVYVLHDLCVDALTGEPVCESGFLSEQITFEELITSMKNGIETADSYELSEEEYAEFSPDKDPLTKNEAVAKAKAQIPSNKLASLNLKNAYLSYDYYNGICVWSIFFPDAYASVNAETGELLKYYYCSEKGKGTQNLSQEECLALVEKYLKSKLPEKYSKIMFSSSNVNSGEQAEIYNFSFNRIENGLYCNSNEINVMISSKNGQIYYYDCTWDNNTVIPQINDTLTKDQLMGMIDENYNLEYQQVGSNGEVRLVYGFKDMPYLFWDPYTGQPLSYYGEPYEMETLPEYTDIKGSYCEDAVTRLVENGYYLEEENEFKPKQKITQLSFFKYLYSGRDEYYENDEELYDLLIEEDILSEGEAAPDSILTRQEAAKHIVRYLNLEMAAEHPDIYKVKIKDTVAENYIGYVALVNSLGIMTADSKGRFNGNAQMTNGEAAVVIYRLLLLK